MNQTCKTCRFYEDREGEKRGRCRVNAPVPVASTSMPDQFKGRWPLVWHDDWCGKYEEQSPAEVKS